MYSTLNVNQMYKYTSIKKYINVAFTLLSRCIQKHRWNIKLLSL